MCLIFRLFFHLFHFIFHAMFLFYSFNGFLFPSFRQSLFSIVCIFRWYIVCIVFFFLSSVSASASSYFSFVVGWIDRFKWCVCALPMYIYVQFSEWIFSDRTEQMPMILSHVIHSMSYLWVCNSCFDCWLSTAIPIGAVAVAFAIALFFLFVDCSCHCHRRRCRCRCLRSPRRRMRFKTWAMIWLNLEICTDLPF